MNPIMEWKWVILVAVFWCSHVVVADEPKDPTSGLVVTGKAVSKEEMDKSAPVATFSKDEIVSVIQTGKPACRNGNVSASFDGKTFSSGGENFSFDELVTRMHALKEDGKVSCFHLRARRYDRKIFKELERALVNENQISLFWDESK